ncbi:MAG: N-6 DNA methylase [Acidimicrobiales bacterium]|nr:N-6 DNA methylase [Acidimicrobiales bacterium]
MSGPGAVVAAAFAARCAERRLDAHPALAVLGHDDGRPAHDPDPARSLGAVHEQLVVGEARVSRGAWYTPDWLAADLVARAFPEPGAVADPACGGGAFLLAAARRLRAFGVAPERIVAELLVGVDIDPLAVAVCEAELWLWSADEGRETLPGRVTVGDALAGDKLPRVDAVVGNPPFLGQLKTGTAVDAERRRRLAARWGDAVQAYTDSAGLFLLAAVDAVRPGGRVVMVQPQSVLAARDTARVRARVADLAELEDCWVDDGTAFEASVHVCAPVLRRRDDHVPNPGAELSWVEPILRANGVPATTATGTATVADRGTVLAGFRDEYYGLVDHVHEGGDGPRLVTSGSIDPFRVRTGSVRFAKQRWTCPTVDTASLTGRACRWTADQHGPKLLVASQTKVVEAAVDPDGRYLAGVPVIVVRPHDHAELWHLAAALHAPCVSTWMLRRTIGTGLSAGACRPTAALIAQVPLPDHRDVWDEAAGLAERMAAGESVAEAFAVSSDAAYGVDDAELRSWWLDRVPVP